MIILKILIVDDEPIILNGMARTVRRVAPGAEVFATGDCEEALSFCRRRPADVAFLDIEMPQVNGLNLAEKLKDIHPEMNIVFTTGYPEYAVDSYRVRASGYLLKPVSEKDILKELENLRHVPAGEEQKKLTVRTFGSFEASVDGRPLRFRYSKTSELLAYMIDRSGAFCTKGELEAALWEGETVTQNTEVYLRQLRKDLLDTLESAGCRDAVESGRANMRVVPERISCDFYDWQNGSSDALHRYRGEYMAQYSWAEMTNGWLMRKLEAAASRVQT